MQNKGRDRKKEKQERSACHICRSKGHYPEECAKKMSGEEFKKRAQEENWCHICLRKRPDMEHSYLNCKYFKFLIISRDEDEEQEEILCQDHMNAPPHIKLYCKKMEGPPGTPQENKQTQTDPQGQLERRSKEVLGNLEEEKKKVKKTEGTIIIDDNLEMKRDDELKMANYIIA